MPNNIITAALEPILKCHRQQQIRKKITLLWTALGSTGLLYALIRHKQGWDHPHAFTTFITLWITGTLILWIQHRRTRLSLREVARRIEQEHPKLEAALITALDQQPDPKSGDYHLLQTRVIREALENNLKEPWDQPFHIQLFFTGVLRFASLLIVAFGAYLIKNPIESEKPSLEASVYSGQLAVEPGNVEMERGDAVVITARFGQKVPSKVSLVVMPANGQTQTLSMKKSMDDPLFGASLLSVDADTVYYVEFDGKKSETYKLLTFEHPKLQQADAYLNYPAYTDEEPRTIKDTLRISAVEGTQLDYEFLMNKPVARADLKDRDGNLISLKADTTRSNIYRLTTVLQESSRYLLDLEDKDGRVNKLPAEIVIKVSTNQPPALKLTFPGGDQRFSALEEVTFEGETWDDFGLKAHGFGFQVSGEEPVDIQLGGEAPAKKKVDISHLLTLEDLTLEPGGLVSYYLWAEDIGPDGSLRRAYSDMYFGEIRPFEEIFTQGQPNAQQQQQQQQQGEQGSPAQQLAELQKEIISATWNTRREQSGSAISDKGHDDLQIVLSSQEDAIAQTDQILEAAAQEPQAAELLTQAKEAMEKAADNLYDAVHDRSMTALSNALIHEQTAYQLILKANPKESSVTQGGGGGGGGGGRSQQQLNQLEMTEEQDRYETQSQASGMQNEQQNEALQNLNRLKELARRQEDLNERLQELQTALSEAESQGQEEEIERELKRLRDEQRRMLEDMDDLNQRLAENESPENAESMSQLDQVREQAQKAAESIEEQEISDALAAGSRAQEGLEEMKEDFRERNSSQFSEAMKELRKRTRELSERQDELQERLNQAQGAQQRQSLGASSQAQEAMEISEKQQQEIDQIMEDVRRISDESEIAEPLLSRQLSETFRRTDQDQLTEMLETTRQLSRLNMVDKAAELERQIHPEIESLEERIDQAAQSILGDGVESLRRARDLLDELSEDLNQEIAQATSQTGDPTGSSPQEGQPSQQGQGASPQENTKETPTQMAQGEGNPPGQGQNDSQEATEARGQGSGPTPGQGNDSNQGESEEIAQSAEGSSGQGQGNSPGQGQGQGRGSDEQPQERQELRNGQGQSELAQSWMNQGGGGNGGGESNDNPQGPLTGNEFREWTDQLREAEEMVDVPELQNDIAAIRDRAQAVRRELRNEGKEPQWDLVQLQIEKPLYEVKKRINEELAKRLSKEAVVPIDRDPVPQEFSDLVRTYYETLGEGR